MSKLDTLRAALLDRNVQAFLRVVREGESTQDPIAYRWMYGKRVFDDLSDHPRQAWMSPWGWTSASGAYQAMCAVPGKVTTDTWGDFVRDLGPRDFSPASQDLFAAWCINRRGALQDVIEGRIEAAIAKCGKEWASLPGSPYGQPVMTLARALATFSKWVGTQPPTPALEAPTGPQIEPAKKESFMAAPISFLWGLASSLIDVFAPVARAGITNAMSKHTDNPEVAGRIADVVIDSAKALTKINDPIEAVAAAKQDPTIVAQIQSNVLDDLEKLAPVLDKLSQWDKQAWDAEEASRAAAADRAREGIMNQDSFLTRSTVWILVGLLVIGAILIGVITWLGKDPSTLIGFWISLSTLVGNKYGTRMDHQYGSSRGSSAKDATMAQLSRQAAVRQ